MRAAKVENSCPNGQEFFCGITSLAKAGILLVSESLQPNAKDVRVKFSGSKRTVVDGPFTETKELVRPKRARNLSARPRWRTMNAADCDKAQLKFLPASIRFGSAPSSNNARILTQKDYRLELFSNIFYLQLNSKAGIPFAVMAAREMFARAFFYAGLKPIEHCVKI